MVTAVDFSIGPLVIGIAISTFLYGIATVQTYIYFQSNVIARDPLRLKIMVIVVWSLESLMSVLACMYLYSITVTNFGNFEALDDLPWTLDLFIFVGGVTSAIVQSFFAWRVHVISRRWFISILVWICSILRVSITLAICILAIQEGQIQPYEVKYSWTIILSLTVSTAVDVTNTSSLCFYLYNMRSVYKQTNSLLDKAMTWAIETGLLTSVCAVLILIFELLRPHWNIWLGILMLYTKLYSNSLLLSLNRRSFESGLPDLLTFSPEKTQAPQTVVNVSRITQVNSDADEFLCRGKIVKSHLFGLSST